MDYFRDDFRDDARDGVFLDEDFFAGFPAPARLVLAPARDETLGNLSGTTTSSPRWKRIAIAACAMVKSGNTPGMRSLNAKQFNANAPCVNANHFSPTRVVRSLSLSALAKPHTTNRDPNRDTMNAPPALDLTVCVTVPRNGPVSIVGTKAKSAARGCAIDKNSNPTTHSSVLRCNASVLARTMGRECDLTACVCRLDGRSTSLGRARRRVRARTTGILGNSCKMRQNARGRSPSAGRASARDSGTRTTRGAGETRRGNALSSTARETGARTRSSTTDGVRTSTTVTVRARRSGDDSTTRGVDAMVFGCFSARERGGRDDEDPLAVASTTAWRAERVGGGGDGGDGEADGERSRGKGSLRSRARAVDGGDDECAGDARDDDVGDRSDASESEGSGREPDMGLDRATYNFNSLNGVATNPALLFWLKRRQMWVNPGRSRRRAKRTSSDKRKSIPRHASYDSFLGVARPHDGPFKTPIPLAEMVEFLNDCWAEGEGL
jgi:hypothetical protein